MKEELADLIMRALSSEYPTGIAYMDYVSEFGTIDVNWVNGDDWQIDLNLRVKNAKTGLKWEAF